MNFFKRHMIFAVVILIGMQCMEISAKSVKYENNKINESYIKNFRVSARNAIAFDGKSGDILWQQNAHEIVPMASTTKILTSLIAINYGDLDRTTIISKKAASIRGSTVGYKEGEEISIRELLVGLMFKSGNDAAIAIAEDIGGSVENFSNIMNDFAHSLGIVDSNFESPHGLDSQNHYSSAYDLAFLASKAMKNKFFREVVGEKIILKDKYNFTREYQNINKILYKIPQANGVKTGYTGQAGKCLVSSIRYNDRDIIIVVLNCPDRWNVTEKIYEHVTEIMSEDCIDYDRQIDASFASLGKIIEDKEFISGYKHNKKYGVKL